MIKLLEKQEEKAYTQFLLEQEQSMLYYSLHYRDLISTYTGAEPYYFIAQSKQQEIIGVFPLMIANFQNHGKVANSLPFYGSNGALLLSNTLNAAEKEEISSSLMSAAKEKIEQEQCIASTFITNPFTPEVSQWIEKNTHFDFKDFRIGQITPMPAYSENLDEDVISIYSNPRPRNIRKAIKSGVTVRFSNDVKDMDFLFETHKQNIDAIGGKSKEKQFFDTVLKVMPKETYKIYIAEKDGEMISALLLFYFNKTVEYFTPATVHDYRNIQPSSLLIFKAMKDAIREGFTHWNWGGTWQSQGGVYDFKKKWGAEDMHYEYYTKIYNTSILESTAQQLQENYPFFFVVPFQHLAKEKNTV